MGDGRLCLGPEQLRVEVSEPAAHRYGHLEHDFGGDGLLHEEVVQRPKLMILGDEPKLRDSVVGHHVARKETQDVVVTQEQRVVDLGLATPRLFVAGKELLHGDWFALVVAEVDLSVAPVPDELGDLDGACDGALDEEWEAGAAPRRNRHVHQLHFPRGLGLFHSLRDAAVPLHSELASPEVVDADEEQGHAESNGCDK